MQPINGWLLLKRGIPIRAVTRALLLVLAMDSISTPHVAAAQDSMTLTGADFLAACSRPDPESIGFCHGYVQAVFDGARRPGEDLCPAPGTTRAQIVGMVVRQLIDTPDLRSFNAASVVYAVLIKSFPCK